MSKEVSSESEAEAEPIFIPQTVVKKQPFARKSVCAEVFGKFNLKANFIPNVVDKPEYVKQNIRDRLKDVFMFADLS